MRASHAESLAWIEQAAQSDTDECLEWPHTRLPKEYGQVQIAGRKRFITHLVLEATGRPRPAAPSNMALHSCDNPPCANPRHLSWGGPKRNWAEGRERGQIVPRSQPKGHESPNAALSPEQVAEVRRAYAAGEGSYPVLARRFGVCTSTIWRAVRQITYA